MKDLQQSEFNSARILVHEQLLLLHEAILLNTENHRDALLKVHPDNRKSASNLLHYLALRSHDLRPLQVTLSELGLSSLGRCESHVLATVETVIDTLGALTGKTWEPPDVNFAAPGFSEGEQLLTLHADQLLGEPEPGRKVRIMITMPGEAGSNYSLVHDLLRNGMNCMRINCAHDDIDTWAQMIANLRKAEKALGKSCKIMMDLAGPKLRTGAIESQLQVLKIRPRKDNFGQVMTPALLWLTAVDNPYPPPPEAVATLHVDSKWLASLQAGKTISLKDARKARRKLLVISESNGGCMVEAGKTLYLVPGTQLNYRSDSGNKKHQVILGELPLRENSLDLHQGDQLVLTAKRDVGRNRQDAAQGNPRLPARISCTLPEVFADLKPGESIWFDDGKIGGIIEQVDNTQVTVSISHIREGGDKLRADKGINLPDSTLSIPALTESDKKNLAFIASHADAVELSFCRSSSDVALLQKELERHGRADMPIILKIETRQAFDMLPKLLLTAMGFPLCGVMIARGDLAVESGFERLAEEQEEILWICEAAHIPVIWATQVLESMAKAGMPSRAEITDAAMGDRAECVMLNKGSHICQTVSMLDDILRRMQAHQRKKTAMLRELHMAHALETAGLQPAKP